MSLKFQRDDYSHGLVNMDIQNLEAYKNRRRKSQRLVELEEELLDVRKELNEIKELFTHLLPK